MFSTQHFEDWQVLQSSGCCKLSIIEDLQKLCDRSVAGSCKGDPLNAIGDLSPVTSSRAARRSLPMVFLDQVAGSLSAWVLAVLAGVCKCGFKAPDRSLAEADSPSR